MSVVPISKEKPASPATKSVEANQKSIDALPFNSGLWKVNGFSGLYVRARATSKSFMLQRRVAGDLVKAWLGPLTMKAAKEEAMKQWGGMERSEPAPDDALTLGKAIEQYVEAKVSAGKMVPKTAELARYNARRYFDSWKDRTLEDIGKNRLAIRQYQQNITKKHGSATSNQCVRLVAAVYRWCRETDENLPEWPRKAAELHEIKPRDWAYSPDELRAWWHVEKQGEDGEKGVKTLGPVKRMWWLTALFTGARKGSIEALRWSDVDIEKKVIRFQVTKGDRPYAVPMADALADFFTSYRDREALPSEWVFPSRSVDGTHMVDVKNPNEGVGPAHRLRHTFRTTLAELGVSSDQSRLLMGHSMGGDVSRGYITSSLVLESLRPITNAVAQHYGKILNLEK